MSLSVVLATFNEEKTLPDCLESVKGLADEIIIVDGTSKDRTVDVAKKYGAKVTVRENPPVFHINKQKAIDMATKEWILQLDADERLTPELREEIKEKINPPAGGQNSDVTGYWIPRKNWYLGRFLMKGGVYPDYTLRLYKRGKGHLPMKDVHEQAVVDGKTDYLENPMIHIADPEFGRYLMRFNRYTSLMAKELEERRTGYKVTEGIKHLFLLPPWWFVTTYGRHKGFMDGWQGFVFSFFSSLRFPVAYVKFLRRRL